MFGVGEVLIFILLFFLLECVFGFLLWIFVNIFWWLLFFLFVFCLFLFKKLFEELVEFLDFLLIVLDSFNFFLVFIFEVFGVIERLWVEFDIGVDVRGFFLFVERRLISFEDFILLALLECLVILIFLFYGVLFFLVLFLVVLIIFFLLLVRCFDDKLKIFFLRLVIFVIFLFFFSSLLIWVELLSFLVDFFFFKDRFDFKVFISVFCCIRVCISWDFVILSFVVSLFIFCFKFLVWFFRCW